MSRDTIQPMITRRNFIKGIGLVSASAALAACSQAPQGANQKPATPLLAIIHTNDTHGHDVAVEANEDIEGNFSMAAVPALKQDWEKKGYDVVLVDAGDAMQGMPLVDTTYGAPAIAFMNACGYDLMAPGNHEFDWSVESLAANEKAAKFPLISANIIVKETGELRFPANKVIELTSGSKVGFFGLTTPATSSAASPKNVGHLTFLNGDEIYACARAQVKELRDQGCDLVVCVGHMGNNDLSGCTSKELIEHVEGIDLFIDGHDHMEVQEEVNGTLLVETGCFFHNIGVVAIDEGAPSSELVAAGTFDGIDRSVQAIIASEDARVNHELDVVLGETPFFLDGNNAPGVRTQETNLGDFCADAYRWTASQELGMEVDASVVNGGAIRVPIDDGDISLKIIKEVVPFSNQLAVLNVTGAQLLEALEAACQAIGTEGTIGAFPQVSNITFTLDASISYEPGPEYPDSVYASPAAPGARVTITDVAGRGFNVNETYSIATTDFLCAGGGTYYAFKEAADIQSPTYVCFDYEALASYLIVGCDHTVPDDYEEPQGRINIIGLE